MAKKPKSITPREFASERASSLIHPIAEFTEEMLLYKDQSGIEVNIEDILAYAAVNSFGHKEDWCNVMFLTKEALADPVQFIMEYISLLAQRMHDMATEASSVVASKTYSDDELSRLVYIKTMLRYYPECLTYITESVLQEILTVKGLECISKYSGIGASKIFVPSKNKGSLMHQIICSNKANKEVQYKGEDDVDKVERWRNFTDLEVNWLGTILICWAAKVGIVYEEDMLKNYDLDVNSGIDGMFSVDPEDVDDINATFCNPVFMAKRLGFECSQASSIRDTDNASRIRIDITAELLLLMEQLSKSEAYEALVKDANTWSKEIALLHSDIAKLSAKKSELTKIIKEQKEMAKQAERKADKLERQLKAEQTKRETLDIEACIAEMEECKKELAQRRETEERLTSEISELRRNAENHEEELFAKDVDIDNLRDQIKERDRLYDDLSAEYERLVGRNSFDDSIPLEHIVSRLADKRIVIVGGSDALLDTLKTVGLKNTTQYSVDAKQIDKGAIYGAYMVVIMTSCVKHKTAYVAKETAKSRGINLLNFDGSNVEKLCREIYKYARLDID